MAARLKVAAVSPDRRQVSGSSRARRSLRRSGRSLLPAYLQPPEQDHGPNHHRRWRPARGIPPVRVAAHHIATLTADDFRALRFGSTSDILPHSEIFETSIAAVWHRRNLWSGLRQIAGGKAAAVCRRITHKSAVSFSRGSMPQKARSLQPEIIREGRVRRSATGQSIGERMSRAIQGRRYHQEMGE